MTIRRSIAAQAIVALSSLALSFVIGAGLPDRVVTHWGINGQPDGWGSKWVAMLLMPAILIGMAGLTAVLPRLSPKGFQLENSGKTYGWLMFVVSCLMAAIHVVILLKTAGATFDIVRATLVVLFAAWIVMGNVIGRVRRNYYMGIRTPWTLSSERVWTATHRAAGFQWVIGGVVGLLAALVGVSPAFMFAYFMVLCFVPVVHSYVLYQRLER